MTLLCVCVYIPIATLNHLMVFYRILWWTCGHSGLIRLNSPQLVKCGMHEFVWQE
jgi:hypothetical protein